MEKWQYDMPASIASIIQGGAWYTVTDGQSGAVVLRLAGERYLKITPADHPQPVHDEALRLLWLADQVPVPQVIEYAENESYQYLLMTALDGMHPFHDELSWTSAQRVTALVAAARRVHHLPVRACPFVMSLDNRLQQAEARIPDTPTGRARFADLVRGRDAQAVFDELVALRPDVDDPVLTHGDLYPVNLRFDPDTRALNGVIDVGAVGVADRYLDLAVMVNAIIWHLGVAWVTRFFALYGIALNRRKLRFYRLLSAFF